MKLISRLSSLRPHAYIIIFTDNPKVKSAVAINFGVYVYPKSEWGISCKDFIAKHGYHYGFNTTQSLRILRLEVENAKIAASRIINLN